jgi:L-seryl-tRNA(Ser) seleniumtransferase
VTFSGDKLLGGPEPVSWRAEGLRRPMRRNPLYRALRVDKMILAALDATLVEHENGRAETSVPVLRMLHAPVAEVRARAETFAVSVAASFPALRPELVPGESAVGGGASPTVGVPTVVVALDPGAAGPDRLAAALRRGEPPVVVRVADDRVLVDLRTVLPGEEDLLLAALLVAARE